MNLVGIMWNRNEADILEETILDAITKVDSLFIADDGSTDTSWEIISNLKGRFPDKIEYIQRGRTEHADQGCRQSLLNVVRERYKAENTWVQIIESDMMILETDIRESLKTHACHDVAMSWLAWNALRLPGTWKEVDTYPNWKAPIKEIMNRAGFMEHMVYTFRPLKQLYYDPDRWRPWPRGFNKEIGFKKNLENAPLLLHFGYRGPTHFYMKYKDRPNTFKHSYPNWDLTSPETVEKTVAYFNGEFNYKKTHPASRAGWRKIRGL